VAWDANRSPTCLFTSGPLPWHAITVDRLLTSHANVSKGMSFFGWDGEEEDEMCKSNFFKPAIIVAGI
jgi:hypothetical protein